MLDDVHDWDKLQTRVYLDERLLSAQRNADRARLGKQEYYLPTVPPASHSNSLKSKPSRQNSASDWSLGGVHYDTSRDKEQHPSNLQTTKIRGQSCLCANSKVSESHDFAGPCRHEILPAASRKVQTPNGLDCKNPSSPAIFYQGRPPSDLDSGQGHTNGNKHLFHHDSCNPQISTCSDHSEFPSIHFDTTLKAVDIPIEHSSPNTGISCEKRCNDTSVPNNNISTPLLHHSTNSELRTFRIASNTPCAPFSGENKSSLLPRRVRRRIHQLQKRLQQALQHSTFNTINHQRQLKRRRECMQRPSCLRSKVRQCFTSKKSAPTLSSVHLQTAVRSTTSPYKNTAMAATGTNPISHSQQSHKFASTPTMENTDRHKNIECTPEPDPLPQIHAKLRLHEYNSHLTSPRGENQTHLLTKPQSITSLSNRSRGKYITSLMSPRVTPTVPSDSDFKLSKEEGNRRTGSMRKLDVPIWDSGINIHGTVEINIFQDNETGYSDLQGRNSQLDTVSRANEPMVSITQRREGHDDQHHQYHSYFGNNSPATTKANFLCYRCTTKLSSIRASPKRHSATSWIHINLFFKPHVSRETHQRRDFDSPYRFVSPSTLRNSSIGSSLVATGSWNTTSPVRLPRKRFYGIHRGIRRMKRQRRTPQKSQHITTVGTRCRLTIRINTLSILNAAFEEFETHSGREDIAVTFFYHISTFTSALANRRLGKFVVRRALLEVQKSRIPAILTASLDVISRLRYRQQSLQRTRHSPRLEFLCQLTPEIGISLTTVRGWNATSPVHIPGKQFRGIGRGSERMKQRPCSTRKRRCVRMMRDLRQLVIIIHTQLIPHIAFEDFSITSESGRKFVMTSFHYLLSFNFISTGNVFRDFLGHRAFRELWNSQCPTIHMVLWDLATRISDRQQRLQRIRRPPRLEIITEVTVVKQESKRLPTYRLQCAAFNTLLPKLNWTEKTEHDQLIQRAFLIHSSDDVPSNRFITSIAVSSDFISRNAETSLLACSTSLAPTAPGPSADDTKVLGLKSCIHTPGDEMDNSETSRQRQKLDTISNVNGMMARSIRRRNDGAHHQYCSRLGNGPHKPAAHADSQLLRMQHRASSTRISHEPNLGAYSCGNHFEFTIIVDSGHSLTGPDRAPKLDFNLILDPSMDEKSVHDGMLECSEPFPQYVEDVG
ncbi:hypothetical protein ARMGADRAFT_1035728 [Armillaria gallica]|uniref:Uncharacterized protein n=1 Tax=Armillaria gallica TaxID=47427 RepID=A0A2H3CTB8_ARMGA|nr:hypothetical protein ARMGADRAFT_1035728 [Armillaria gallica]